MVSGLSLLNVNYPDFTKLELDEDSSLLKIFLKNGDKTEHNTNYNTELQTLGHSNIFYYTLCLNRKIYLY